MATPPKDPTDTPPTAVKPPAPRKPATPRKAAAPRKTVRKTAAASGPAAKPATRKPAPRAAAAKPATPATAAKKPTARRSPAKPKAAPAGTSKWGLAAVIGGVGAALTAGLLALRGSTPKEDEYQPNAGSKAHQADGTDSSASFEAGIADEGTIPE